MICAICVIFIISMIGATVLLNSTTRYNVTSTQVKAWKEAMYAAEAGGDVGFAATRKLVNSSETTAFNGWATPSPAPTPGPSWSKSNSFGPSGTSYLSYQVTVDRLQDGSTPPISYYRIRAVGTARLFGLQRAGMDDALIGSNRNANFAANSSTRGDGDSLLRKIDFNYDHFIATYGDGDGNGATLRTVVNPQLTRRIELVSVPDFSFTGSLKVTGVFFGPGPAGQIDSYDSKNGAYPGRSTASTPSANYYADSRNGDVAVDTSSFSENGPIYGNVTTNGGNVTNPPYKIYGTIDNNVPFYVPPLAAPDTSGYTATSATTLTPASSGTYDNPNTYVYNSSMDNGVTIHVAGYPVPWTPVLGTVKPETYVKIVVNGYVKGPIKIDQGVNVQLYFTGDFSSKAADLVNNNQDNQQGLNQNGNPSRAAHMQFYGISPADGSYQNISINAGGGSAWATMYAPNGNMTLTGNADWYGAIVAHDFTGNGSGAGNTGFHYDKRIAASNTRPVDYHIASYAEDIR